MPTISGRSATPARVPALTRAGCVSRHASASTRGLALAFALATLTATGCASSSPQASSGVRASPNLLTADEIARVNVESAYEAVQKLRPTMLRPRQMSSANAQATGELLIYVDNSRLGPVESLRQIPASSIALVRYYSASEAQMKWGSGHPGGVIEVVTKR